MKPSLQKSSKQVGNAVSVIDITNTQFDLQAWPFYWITRTNNAYLRRLEEALKANDLDIPRWRVLMLLHGKTARSVSYLAEESIVKLPTMTRIIQRMVDEGLVESRLRESDNRVTEVLLTATGRHARVRARREAQRVFERAFANVSAGELETLNKILAKVLLNLNGDG